MIIKVIYGYKSKPMVDLPKLLGVSVQVSGSGFQLLHSSLLTPDTRHLKSDL